MHTPPDRREPSTKAPQPAEASVEIRIRIPRTWRDELQHLATERAISTSDLVRIILRGFLRERYAGTDNA